MTQTQILRHYADQATELAQRFDALEAATVLTPVAAFLPQTPADIADIGAGSGRDAAWLAEAGHRVTAVEPVAEFIRHGRRYHTEQIEWVKDRLPELTVLRQSARRFDLVLCNAVWHHLLPDQSASAMSALAGTLRDDASLILSLKAFGDPSHNTMNPDLVIGQAGDTGLDCVFRDQAASHSPHNQQAGTTWHWLVFQPTRRVL